MASAPNAKAKMKHKKKLLSNSRPGPRSQASSSTTPTLSSRLTRKVIRSHHTLQKQLQRAQASGDTNLAESLQSQLDAAGGLPAYQRASIQGQSAERGGDSSRVLVEWLQHAHRPDLARAKDGSAGSKLRLLEVGALRPDNACSRSGLFDVERIDLHSQHPSIRRQDFMERPVPRDESERAAQGFDVVSLSLVVNYVGDAVGRGEMLRRVRGFLREPAGLVGEGSDDKVQRWFPGLFLVLPSPCVLNSRYLDEERLRELMQSLGFNLVARKISSKLAYYYFVYDHRREGEERLLFRKKELRKGGSRNNFAIVLL